jgi:ferrochelatase
MAASGKALVLMNLGSPDAPEVKEVRRYLNEFLMDSRVLDFPVVFRYPLVKWIITPFRSPNSAKAYQKVWRKDGSPLIVLTQKLADGVQQQLDYPVKIAMRYGNPSPRTVFDQLMKADPGLKEVIAFPLYPHYTMSSYETAVASARAVHKKYKYPFKLKFVSPFYNHPDYIAALAAKIAPYLNQDYDKILFSYHGLPERHMGKDDITIQKFAASGGNHELGFKMPEINYQKQCHETTRLVTEALHIPEEKYETSFQSRLKQAGNEWIKPYTAPRLEELPAEGTKKLLVVCPAFINDCLETLEEIAMEGKHSFESAGGEQLIYIPCLNDADQWVNTVVKWVKELE